MPKVISEARAGAATYKGGQPTPTARKTGGTVDKNELQKQTMQGHKDESDYRREDAAEGEKNKQQKARFHSHQGARARDEGRDDGTHGVHTEDEMMEEEAQQKGETYTPLASPRPSGRSRRESESPNEGQNDASGHEEEEEEDTAQQDEDQEKGKPAWQKVSGSKKVHKQKKGLHHHTTHRVKALHWVKKSVQVGDRGKVQPEHVIDAAIETLMDFNDVKRLSGAGAVQNVPAKFAAQDTSMPGGPFWFGFETEKEAKAYSKELGGLIMVEIENDEIVYLHVNIDTNTRDIKMDAIEDEETFWMEVYVGKSGLFDNPKDATNMLCEQLGIDITNLKYPRPKVQGAKHEKVKLCVKAMEGLDEEFKHPSTLRVRTEKRMTINLRYKVQDGFFPSHCHICHYKTCVCEKRKNYADMAKAARGDGRERKAAGRRINSQRTEEQKQESIKNRSIMNAQRASVESTGDICAHFQYGSCKFGAKCNKVHKMVRLRPGTNPD